MSRLVSAIGLIVIAVGVVIAPDPGGVAFGQADLGSDPIQARVLPISTEISTSARDQVIVKLPTSVRWEGHLYDVDAGIDALMVIITEPATTRSTRAKAISKLGQLSTLLQDRECLRTLRELYPTLQSRSEKAQVLTCMTLAKDPIGLPLLYVEATVQTDPVLRFYAASGLASWNIRDGIRQLIELLSSAIDAGSRDLGAAAMISFTRLNTQKDWGCPQDEMRTAAFKRGEGTGEKSGQALLFEYRQWFEANEHRFPEWKLGDPLPVIPEPKTDNPDE